MTADNPRFRRSISLRKETAQLPFNRPHFAQTSSSHGSLTRRPLVRARMQLLDLIAHRAEGGDGCAVSGSLFQLLHGLSGDSMLTRRGIQSLLSLAQPLCRSPHVVVCFLKLHALILRWKRIPTSLAAGLTGSKNRSRPTTRAYSAQVRLPVRPFLRLRSRLLAPACKADPRRR